MAWVMMMIVADQYTKYWVMSQLPLGHVYPVFEGLNWVHAHNRGIALSLFSDASQGWLNLLTALSCAVIIALSLALRCLRATQYRLCAVIVLLLGGAIGNLIDRIRWGYVIDWIDVYWRHWHFPAFNLADAAITLGALIVLCVPHQDLALWMKASQNK